MDTKLAAYHSIDKQSDSELPGNKGTKDLAHWSDTDLDTKLAAYHSIDKQSDSELPGNQGTNTVLDTELAAYRSIDKQSDSELPGNQGTNDSAQPASNVEDVLGHKSSLGELPQQSQGFDDVWMKMSIRSTAQ